MSSEGCSLQTWLFAECLGSLQGYIGASLALKVRVWNALVRPVLLYGCRSGGWGPSASIVFKRLASMISEKHSSSYSSTMKMIRSKVAFSLIDSAIMCLRGARSSFHRPVKALNLIDNPIDLMVNEGQI